MTREKLGEELSRDVSKQSALETEHEMGGRDQGHAAENAEPRVVERVAWATDKAAMGWSIQPLLHNRHPSVGIRMREFPVVEWPHIIAAIPAFGRCRCRVDRS